jgi:hypothetical protein
MRLFVFLPAASLLSAKTLQHPKWFTTKPLLKDISKIAGVHSGPSGHILLA